MLEDEANLLALGEMGSALQLHYHLDEVQVILHKGLVLQSHSHIGRSICRALNLITLFCISY